MEVETEKRESAELHAAKKRKANKNLEQSFNELSIDPDSTRYGNKTKSSDEFDKSLMLNTTTNDTNNNPTRRSTRIKNSTTRLSIPMIFNPPQNPNQSTPAPPMNSTKQGKNHTIFCSPMPAHHYGENTVIRIDGAIASFNQSGDPFDESAKRVQLLDSHLDDDSVRNNVKNKLDLSTIEEERDMDEDSEDIENDKSETVVFTSTCGEKPVTAMIEVLDKNSSIAVTTTVGNADPSQRSAVVDVLDIDDSGKIQVYRKFMAADNWKNLSDDEKKELLNWKRFDPRLQC